MSAKADYIFGGADRILKDMYEREKRKKKQGLLLPKTKRMSEINQEQSRKVLTKEDIEKEMDIVKQELELLYEDAMNRTEVITIHKEGQLHAYKLLLKLLDKK